MAEMVGAQVLAGLILQSRLANVAANAARQHARRKA
jgi:hypothetical protein